MTNFNPRYLSIGLCGASGTGKTSQLGSMRSLGPMFVFDFDGKLTPLAGMDIEYISALFTNKDHASFWPQVNNSVRKLEQAFNKYKDKDYMKFDLTIGTEEVHYDGPKIVTVAFDTMTFARKLMMAFVQTLGTSDSPMMTKHGIPTMNAYTSEMEKTTGILAALKALPCYKVITFHQQVKIIEETSDVFIGPDVTGKALPGQIPGYFDEFYATRIKPGKNPTYLLLMGGSSRYTSNSTVKDLIGLSTNELDTTRKPGEEWKSIAWIVKQVETVTSGAQRG